MDLRRFVLTLLLILLIIVPQLPQIVSAQGGTTLTDGTIVTGTLNDQSRVTIYSFSGNPGDLITASVIGISPGMNPTITLLSPAQQQLTLNDDDPFSAAGTDARVSYLVQDSGF